MSCYAMTELCRKLGIDNRNTPASSPGGSCECQGCNVECPASGPHSHRNVDAECNMDYCCYPCFKPPTACPAGNSWSGFVYTDCNHPEPCKADCYEHLPPGDWNNPLFRKS